MFLNLGMWKKWMGYGKKLGSTSNGLEMIQQQNGYGMVMEWQQTIDMDSKTRDGLNGDSACN